MNSHHYPEHKGAVLKKKKKKKEKEGRERGREERTAQSKSIIYELPRKTKCKITLDFYSTNNIIPHCVPTQLQENEDNNAKYLYLTTAFKYLYIYIKN